MQWVWKAGYEIVAIGYEKLIWWKVKVKFWELRMKSSRRVKVKLWQLDMKNLWRPKVKLWQLGLKNLWRLKVKLWQLGILICVLPKNLGLFWLCKANALLQLPCGAEFELNALYMSSTNCPSLGIKGRAIMLYFITIFILLVTELHVIYCCLHLLCISIDQIKMIYFLDALYLILKFHPWKLGHSSIKCHP